MTENDITRALALGALEGLYDSDLAVELSGGPVLETAFDPWRFRCLYEENPAFHDFLSGRDDGFDRMTDHDLWESGVLASFLEERKRVFVPAEDASGRYGRLRESLPEDGRGALDDEWHEYLDGYPLYNDDLVCVRFHFWPEGSVRTSWKRHAESWKSWRDLRVDPADVFVRESGLYAPEREVEA